MDEKKPTHVEEIKETSNGLAGSIQETFAAGADHLSDDDNVLLKFHGSYQGDDRDLRADRKKQGLEKAWEFMVRCKIPGGRITADQYLALDELADLANGTLRFTSRQSVQYHQIDAKKLKAVIRRINDTRLTTLGACGDVNRNVMCCPVCDLDGRAGLGLQPVAEALAAEFTPQSTSYWEIWCDGERWGEHLTPKREEPFYGKNYLPRKFKIAVGNPEDNCTDFYTNDVALEAVHENGKLVAFDLIAGGGMGHSTGAAATYPRLGSRIARIAPEEVVAVVRSVVEIHRDFGDRTNRKHARLKYIVEERGAAWVKEELEQKLGHALPEAGPTPAYQVEDHLGWHEAQDGSLYVGLYILNGRVRDLGGATQRTGLREIVRRFQPQVRLTAKADIILAGIKPQDRAEIETLISAHGLSTGAGMGELRRLATACVALPTCNLALAEGERFMPTLLEDLERRGVGGAPVEIRLSGCPNSCVRTPGGEIGIVGRSAVKYAVYLGGSQLGTRLSFMFRDMVERDALAPLIESLIRKWQGETNGGGVSFGEWATQKGKDALLAEVPGT